MPTRLVINTDDGTESYVTESQASINTRLGQDAACNPVPLYIDNSRLKDWLIDNSQYDSALAKINAISDEKLRKKHLVSWQFDNPVSRNNDKFIWVFTQMGKTKEEIDQIFRDVALL